MGNTFYFEWEIRFMEWLQQVFGGSVGVFISSLITDLGDEFVCVALLGFFYWGINKELGKYIGINVSVNIVANPLIKNIFVRRRPYFDNPSIKILKPVDSGADVYDIAAQGYSFPSGHSMNSGTVYWSLARKTATKWLRIVIIIIPVLVALSRNILGAHYPTDVIVGLLLGVIVTFLIPFIREKIKKDWILYVILLLIGAIGFFYCNSNDYFSGYGIMLGMYAGFLVEERYVKFENTTSYIRAFVRTLFGGLVFIGLSEGLKMVAPESLKEAGTFASQIFRAVRYALSGFVSIAIYPMLFKYTKKIGKKG